MKQYEICRDRSEVLMLVTDRGGAWVLEVGIDGEARQLLALEDFRRSEQGQRLARQLEDALKSASGDV